MSGKATYRPLGVRKGGGNVTWVTALRDTRHRRPAECRRSIVHFLGEPSYVINSCSGRR
jgi:hypothetical protein